MNKNAKLKANETTGPSSSNNNSNSSSGGGGGAKASTNLSMGKGFSSMAKKKKLYESKRLEKAARIRKHEAERLANRNHWDPIPPCNKSQRKTVQLERRSPLQRQASTIDRSNVVVQECGLNFGVSHQTKGLQPRPFPRWSRQLKDNDRVVQRPRHDPNFYLSCRKPTIVRSS